MIFVVLRYTQLDAILDTLRANPTKNIVFVGNDVRASALSASLPEKNVMFAFASSAGHREREYVASVDLKKITIGQIAGAPSNERLIGQIFDGAKYKVTYEPNMEDYLLCHAAFVLPVAFACYKVDGDLKKLKGNTAYLNRLIDANIEGYRAIKNAGHEILPKDDAEFEGAAYRKTCLRFFKLMCATSLREDMRVRPRDERGRRNERAEPRFEGFLRRERRGLSRVARAGKGGREVFAMKYAGMPMGMWVLFAASFRRQLTAVFGYDKAAAASITKASKSRYKEIIARLPEFEREDQFRLNIVGCAILVRVHSFRHAAAAGGGSPDGLLCQSDDDAPMRWFCRERKKQVYRRGRCRRESLYLKAEKPRRTAGTWMEHCRGQEAAMRGALSSAASVR